MVIEQGQQAGQTATSWTAKEGKKKKEKKKAWMPNGKVEHVVDLTSDFLQLLDLPKA